MYRVSVFSCTVLFVSISQVIGCEDHFPRDLDCVRWRAKVYSNSKPNLAILFLINHNLVV